MEMMALFSKTHSLLCTFLRVSYRELAGSIVEAARKFKEQKAKQTKAYPKMFTFYSFHNYNMQNQNA
jgi:hypothetical protein